MDLRRDFSLKNLALLSWSASFWNRKSVNYKVQRLIDDSKYYPDISLFVKISRNLIPLAKNELKAINLPNVLYDELIQRIIWLGERVLKWYLWCRDIGVCIPLRFTRKIHWTVFGTIDEPKTVEKNFLGPNVTLSGDSDIYGVYYAACASALKGYINRNATKIIDFCRKHENEFEYRFRDLPFLYRSVLTLANPENLNLSDKEKNELIGKYFGNIDCSKEAFMFEFSVSKGYTAAAEYYWLQLNPLEAEDKLMNEAMKAIQDDRFGIKIDVFVFLLSEMSKNQRETFYSYLAGQHRFRKIRIFRKFMKSCAWEDLFFPVFYLLENLNDHEKEYYYDLFIYIIFMWKERFADGLDAKNHVYKQIFLAVWRRLKTFHSENQHFDSWYGRNIFEFFDIDVFKVVLKNYSFRQEFLELGKTHYKDLLMENQFRLLKEFMATVLICPGERAWFKNELISNVYDVIRKHKFNVADNLLDWLSDSKEERERIKLKFDFLSVCAEHFVTKNRTSAKELVTWGFSNEREGDQYIDGIVSSDLDWLHIIWSRNKNNLVTSLFDFLKIFFDTKEAHVGRKIAKLLTEDALRKFFIKMNDIYSRNCSLTRKAFRTLDKLIDFCFPLENGIKLKVQISENAGKWLLHLTREHFCWKVVDVFFNWVSGYEFKRFEEKKTILDCEKKRELVQRFLLSSDGIKFLYIMSTSYHPELFLGYTFLLVEWTGGVGVIDNYMNELDGSNLQDPNCNFWYTGLKNMLRRFKNGDVQYKTLKHVCRFHVNSKSGRCKNKLKNVLMRIFPDN